MDKRGKPSWWICYLINIVFIALIVLNYSTPMAASLHRALACATVLACYGMLAWWLHANRTALRAEPWKKQRKLHLLDGRDAPLSPVQARFLRVMERYRSR